MEKTTLVRLRNNIHHTAKIEAAKDGVTMSEWVGRLVVAEIERRKEIDKGKNK